MVVLALLFELVRFLAAVFLIAGFGAAVGLFAGLLSLPFLASSTVRAAFADGPTPDRILNYLLLVGAGGTVQTLAHEGFVRLRALVSPAKIGTLGVNEQSALVVVASMTLVGFYVLWTRAREARERVGVVGGSLCALAAGWFAVATTVFVLY